MKFRIVFIFIASIFASGELDFTAGASTRKERRLINKGNELYKERKFVDANGLYQQALTENPNSAEARYNLGLSQVRQITDLSDTTANTVSRLELARKSFSDVAALAKDKPGLAAKANLNLGNIEFKVKDFGKAVEYYKQALRIDPDDDKARKNLRIAQLNLRQQQQDQNKDKNQDKDKNKDKDKDKNQDKNKDQNKDSNQNRNEKDKKDKKDNKDNNISPQAASQILKAVDNKESATRARVTKGNGQNRSPYGRNSRRW